MPEPDISLGVGSGSHATQTARIMTEFERELDAIDPAIVLVVGDVNSTLACALVAIKKHYPVAHVEAGLRCFDPWMPEEINRHLTDHLSTHLFTTSRDGDENLQAEGIPAERVYFVGNTMIDTLLRFRAAARERKTAARLGLTAREYAVVTLHRPNTVDAPHQLERVLDAVIELSGEVPRRVPHSSADAATAGGNRSLRPPSGGPGDDRGGVSRLSRLRQPSRRGTARAHGLREASRRRRPCSECPASRSENRRSVRSRSRRERTRSWEQIPAVILPTARRALGDAARVPAVPELWDGQAGERIVEILAREVIGSAATETVA